MPALTLRKTYPDKEDDYEVLLDSAPIGRIYFAIHVPENGDRWFWAYWPKGHRYTEQDHGYAASLEAAKSVFRDRVKGD